MSNILSYSNNITGSDWIGREPYTTDDIEKISDPNGGMAEYPRTAIPSPFAQLDLVSNAFARLASCKLQGIRMDLRLVSDALDIAQLLFDYSNHAERLRMVRWNPSAGLARMRQSSNPDHVLLAQTLRLFMETDADAYNFDIADDWFILMLDNRVIGSTSSATYAMGAPGVTAIEDLMVEEGEPLFGNIRHLWQRDTDFVVYLTHWFNAFPEMRRKLKPVYNYLLVNLEAARNRRPALYSAVQERVGNPAALNITASSELRSQLPALYSEYTIAEASPRVLGNALFVRRRADILQSVNDSDFMLRPVKQQADDAVLPLVLRQGFAAADGSEYTYINRPWREDTIVDTQDKPTHERLLPGTSVVYPWITSTDLLEDCLIELATPIDSKHFYCGETDNRYSQTGYLLPVKPLFFEYFPSLMLASEVVPGKPVFELRRQGAQVIAVLRIPVKKGYVELQRVYRHRVSDQAIDDGADGVILSDVRLNTAIFPFARTGCNDIYNVQLFEMTPGYSASLRFHADEQRVNVQPDREPCVRSHTKVMRTSYYERNSSFDHIRATLISTGGRIDCSGVILPLWSQYHSSSARFTFAVDFGTTNSHVEYSVDDSPAQPLEFTPSDDATLVATLNAAGSLVQSETMLDVEFVPRHISDLYSFPLRTSLAENLTNDTLPQILRSVNIPFLYERKSFNGYKVTTKLKWADNTTLSEQFLRGIMLIIRARVILSRGSLKNTKIVYFYPVSMKRSLQLKYRTLWEQLYSRYICSDYDADIVAFPESVAPAYYYATASRDGSNYVGIDIGGGTSDVVVYRADEERLHSNLYAISSFRFAGDTIFGDGFAGADADRNPLIKQYSEYFSHLVQQESGTSYLDVILSDIMRSKRSEDINAFLFSIEQSEALRGLPSLDRRPFSYNDLLSDDEQRKIVFVYFHAAIIYYVANMMKSRSLDMPKQICFSGTGSKILNILGRREIVEDFTRAIIEKVYEKSYGSVAFRLRMEREAPKQITCKGGLELQRRITAGKVSQSDFSSRNIMAHICGFSTDDSDKQLTYTSIRKISEREHIESMVREFNRFFLELLDRDCREEFGIPQDAADYFAAHVNDSLPNYLAAGIEALLPMEEGGDEEVEDVPFFYPIAGTIRDTMLANLGSKARETTEK